MYGQRLFLQHEPLRSPEPANEAILLDANNSAAHDVRVRQIVGGPIGRFADANIAAVVATE